MAEATVRLGSNITAVAVVETPAAAVDVVETAGYQGPPGPPGPPGAQGVPGQDGSAAGLENDVYMDWLLSLQYTDESLPQSYGAIKRHDDPATRAQGNDWFGVEPYFATLAVYYALEAAPERAKLFAQRWITWWATHRNSKTKTALVHYVNADGSQIATALPGAVPAVHPDAEDATDSNAALWFLALARYISLFGPDGLPVDLARHASEVYDFLASDALRQPDHLTWAKPDWRFKYLMDNVEVWAGLGAASSVFQMLGDTVRRDDAAGWSALLAGAIVQAFWDAASGTWRPSRDEAGIAPAADLSQAYPDALAQVWPAIFGFDVERGGYVDVSVQWPRWHLMEINANSRTADTQIALAAARAGDVLRARGWLVAVAAKRRKAGTFEWPFTCADAAVSSLVARVAQQQDGRAKVGAGSGGSGIRFLGAVASVADLPTDGAAGDAMAVGGRLYVRAVSGAWVDAGPVGVPGEDGQIRFSGHGAPPALIPGARPGDTYLDLDTGDVFKLV